jgi:hypothetical protein
VRVLVPEFPRTMLPGETMQLRPVLGETVSDMETVPVNPRTVVTTTVEVPGVPAFTVAVGVETVRVKS